MYNSGLVNIINKVYNDSNFLISKAIGLNRKNNKYLINNFMNLTKHDNNYYEICYLNCLNILFHHLM